ncbi:MAG: Asp-tRNA(Asn)/Glu-tRNA(Gln) amidotransferase subunit GatA [Armatimonadetes bacterium]|nr:Asp-tRNA(Asn)/Glu-tRNA(Gln) amidotransferase subunit GatA [Armatimonadota bacterium]
MQNKDSLRHRASGTTQEESDLHLHTLTAHELHEMLKARKVSSVELTRAVLERISAVEDKVKAYVTIVGESALEAANAVDEKIARGEEISPLAGIPTAIKDNMCTAGVLTTCSSKILYNYIPPYGATVVKRLIDSGAVVIGKTNLDEFAMGSSTENSAFFATRNPWNLSKVPGGSSGGSAAAVSADEAILALGSDTGGSIRQPASFCGIVGMKPTYGRVSRYGLVAFASSLDQIGPMTKDVTDTAILLNAICGKDPLDSTSVDLPVPDFTRALRNDVRGLKIGVPKEFFAQGVRPEIADAVMKGVELLCSLGADFRELSMPIMEYTLPTYYILAPAEASSNLARYDGVRYGYRSEHSPDVLTMFAKTRQEGFGAEVKQRIMIGTYVLSAGYYDAYYLKAQKVRTLVRQAYDEAFKEFDVLISPTSPTVAFGIGEKVDDPLEMKLADVCTIPINLAGIPAISVPCGFSEGLPIGMQIMGRPFDEETILRVAYTFEQNTEYHTKKPLL